MRRALVWIGVVVLALFILLVTVQGYLMSRDRAANFAFGEKARQNNIKGMPEDSVRKLFGAPDYVYRPSDYSTGEPYHVLVYTPGPRFAFWNSECKITVDDRTETVRAWMINSD